MDNAERAKQMFAEGASDSAVARKLGISPYKAKKLRPGAEKKPARKKGTPKKVAEEVPQDYDVTVTIPTARLVDLFSAFTDVEKATAIQFILQCRMDEALGATE